MSDATKSNVDKFLNEIEDVETLFFHNEFEYSEGDGELQEILEKYAIKATLVDSFGGEGQGEDYWTVWKFEDPSGEVMIQFDGWYASYNGSEMTGRFYVEPVQVTVTQFKRVR